MTKKQLIIEVPKMLIDKINKLEKSRSDLAKIITEKLNGTIVFDSRERLDFYVEEDVYEKLIKLKKETGYPLWKIITQILDDSLNNSDSEIPEVKKEEEHIEPTECPAGCGSTDLLIGYAKYTWHCYNCGENGNY